MSQALEQSNSNWAIARKAASLFLPVAVLVIIILYTVYDRDRISVIETLTHEEKVVVEQQEKHFSRLFNNIIADLLVLSGHADFTEMLNDPDGDEIRHFYNITQEFRSFIDHKGSYDQLRFIDMQGQEVIRIDRNQGHPKIVSEEKLQNKADRYYFSKTITLAKNHIYISAFDLNIENGVIEQPHKPMLRIAMPIFDEFETRAGMIILNYLGHNLLNELEDISINSTGKTLILNMDGYWVKGLDSRDEWGFMFPDKKNLTFQSRYPNEWKTISTHKTGRLLTEQGLFSYTTINPLANGWQSSSGQYKVYKPDESDANLSNYSWKLVSFIPPQTYLDISTRLRTPIIIIGLVFLIIWGMYSLISSNAKVHREQAQRKLRQKDQRIREIVDSAFDGIITMDERGIIESFNPAATAIFGYAQEEIIGKDINILTPSPHQGTHDNYIQQYIESREAHIIDCPKEIEAVRKDGSLFPLSLCVGAKNYGDHWMFTGIVRDITEHKQMQQELEKMAITDVLTGLYNRGHLNRSLESEYRRSIRYNIPLSLIILDIDHFKYVNDIHGHPAGDKVLIELANELKKHSRETDIVTRYGGEEFVLILPQTNSTNGFILAERLRAAIEILSIKIDESVAIKVTISVGLVSIPETKAESADHFLIVADRALYQAKNSGRNRVVLSSE